MIVSALVLALLAQAPGQSPAPTAPALSSTDVEGVVVPGARNLDQVYCVRKYREGRSRVAAMACKTLAEWQAIAPMTGGRTRGVSPTTERMAAHPRSGGPDKEGAIHVYGVDSGAFKDAVAQAEENARIAAAEKRARRAAAAGVRTP